MLLCVFLVACGSSDNSDEFPTGENPSRGEAKVAPDSSTTTTLAADLLPERVGFGAAVTGGLSGSVVVVSSDADSGPGSLREALSQAAPRWVVFERDMTISLKAALRIPSASTIDGRGRNISITGPGVAGFEISGVSNVIIESVNLNGFGDVSKTDENDTADAIEIEASKSIWIDHSSFSKTGDKSIDVTGGSTEVTISWNHFFNQEQVVQIGNQYNRAVDVSQTVTMHHNFFDRTGYRNPVVSYGTAHVFNNYYVEWTTYGVRSERQARMYLEQNVFVAGENPRAALVTPADNGCNDARTLCDSSAGSLEDVENLLLNGAVIRDYKASDPMDRFDPHDVYTYLADKAGPDLATSISDGAGPQ